MNTQQLQAYLHFEVKFINDSAELQYMRIGINEHLKK